MLCVTREAGQSSPESFLKRLIPLNKRSFLILLLLVPLLLGPGASPSLAAGLVLGLVPQPGHGVSSEDGARQLAEFLGNRLDKPVAVRTFRDERSLHHWMNRFREVDLGLFTLAYLQLLDQSEFIPLATCRWKGRREDVMLVARRGVDPVVFTAVSRTLLDAESAAAGRSLLDQVGLACFLPPSEAVAGRQLPAVISPSVAVPRPTVAPVAAVPRPSADTAVNREPDAATPLQVTFPAEGLLTGPTPMFIYRAPPGSSLLLDGQPLALTSGDHLGPLADGEHRLALVSPTGVRLERGFRVDARAPLVTVDPFPSSTRSAEMRLSGSLEDGSRLEINAGAGVKAGAVRYPVPGRWSVELADLLPGEHRLQLVGRDRYGNESRLALVIERDVTPPRLQVVIPAAGAAYPQVPALRLEHEPGELAMLLDGAPLAGTLLPETLADGDHLLQVELSDRAGNRTRQQVAFRIDRGLPELSVDPHPRILAEDHVTLSGRREAHRPLNVQTDPAGITFRAEYPGPERWSLALAGLQEGENRVRLGLTNAAGNRAETELLLVVDRQPPRLEVVWPEEGVSYSSPPELALVNEEATLEVWLDGQLLAVPRLPEQLADGEHLLKVVGRDRAGNRSELLRHFVIDTRPPRLNLIAPAEGLITRGPVKLEIASDAVQLRVLVNGTERPLGSDGELAGVAEGEHLLRVEALDLAGNLSSAERRFTVDTMPPRIDLLSPAEGVLADAQPVFSPVVSDGSLDIWLDGRKLDLAIGEQFPPLADGPHELLLNVVDAAGNRSQLRRHFDIDTQPPDVVILEPASAARVNNPVRPLWHLSEEAVVEVRLDGAPLELVSGDALNELVPGRHLLELDARDPAGNLGSAATEFIVAGPGPQVYISLPMAGVTYDPTPPLKFQAEPGAVRVLLDGVEVAKRSGESLETLANGAHTVRVEVTDANGDVGFAEQRFAVGEVARARTASPLDIPPADTAFAVAAMQPVLPADFDGELQLTIRGLSRLGETIYLQHWLDRNGNGVADAAEPVIGVVKLTDGLVSPAAGVPGDDDGVENRVIVTRIDLGLPDNPLLRSGQHIFLAIGEREVSETVLRIGAE